MAINDPYYPERKESIWKYQDFTLLLSASLLLSIGSKIYELLLPLLMYDLSGSSIMMTSMRTAELLPNFLFGIFIGVIVDRVNKKKWAIAMILFQAIVLIIMYFMFSSHLYSPIIYYLLGFILMTLYYGFFNTQVSLIKVWVPSHLFTSANAKISFVETLAGIMGPLFLGVILLFINKNDGLFLIVILYFVAYLLIQKLSVYESGERWLRSSFWKELKEGWVEFKHNKVLTTMTTFVIFLNCTMTVMSMAVLIYGTVDLSLSNSVLTIVLSVGGIGGLIGSITINVMRERYKLGFILGFSILVNAVAYLIIFLANDVFGFVMSLFLSGYATTTYVISTYTFRHEQSPAHLIGRISGITGTLYRVGMPIAMIISGWIISWWGSPYVFISACIINLIVFVFYRKSVLWRLS